MLIITQQTKQAGYGKEFDNLSVSRHELCHDSNKGGVPVAILKKRERVETNVKAATLLANQKIEGKG